MYLLCGLLDEGILHHWENVKIYRIGNHFLMGGRHINDLPQFVVGWISDQTEQRV
jgi:hypothetical protein